MPRPHAAQLFLAQQSVEQPGVKEPPKETRPYTWPAVCDTGTVKTSSAVSALEFHEENVTSICESPTFIDGAAISLTVFTKIRVCEGEDIGTSRDV